MIELHSHVLYDIDDGAADQCQALLLLSSYAAQGVTDIVCTPHLLPAAFSSPETLATFLDHRDATLVLLQDAADSRSIPIRLHRGSELMLSSAMLPYIRQPEIARRMTLNGGSYLLVELPSVLAGGIRTLDGLLFELNLAGLQPILAHPERTAHNEGVLPALEEWVRSGRILLQVNAGSLVEDPRISRDRQERYRRRRILVLEMMDARLVHFVASDAHDPQARPPQNQLAYDQLRLLYSEKIAWRLFTTNPQSVLADAPLPTD